MKRNSIKILIALSLLIGCWSCETNNTQISILYPEGSTALVKQSAKELNRYLYLRTGTLPLLTTNNSEIANKTAVIIASKENALLASLSLDETTKEQIKGLTGESFLLKTLSETQLLIVGASEISTLYAAYDFLESQGICFYLDTDIIPDKQVNISLSGYNKISTPLFSIRGILPFHDFAEGPDWWDKANYQSMMEQLAKMKMNFFGLHTYTSPNPIFTNHEATEPTVWLGLQKDYDEKGNVNNSYPNNYFNTGNPNWNYPVKNTKDYSFGATQLYEKDFYCNDIMDGFTPLTNDSVANNKLINNVGDLFAEIFTDAQALGIKTCVGTEAPLALPNKLVKRLEAMGLDPKELTTKKKIYAGIFDRIAKKYPLDYYWIWTPESWIWDLPPQAEVDETVEDIKMAIKVHKELNVPFQLASSGWALGPPKDPSLFDSKFDKSMTFSCINLNVGYAPVDHVFYDIEGRDKWVIPWMEDDPAMISPQFWVGRVRRDAKDALAYNSNGLIGIHWRTKILSPSTKALAQAGWNQGEWNKEEDYLPTERVIPNIKETKLDKIYGTVAYNPRAYVFKFPKDYKVNITLKFAEIEDVKKGERVFDIKINNKVIRKDVDIYAEAGKDTAFDISYKNIWFKNDNPKHEVKIEFIKKTGYPMISGLEIIANKKAKYINCNAEQYKYYESDPYNHYNARHPYFNNADNKNYESTADFYDEWCAIQFGQNISERASVIFQALDYDMPTHSKWDNGPGRLKIYGIAWDSLKQQHAYVGEFEALGSEVIGKGNKERFAYWYNKLAYNKAMGKLGCAIGQLDSLAILLEAEENASSIGRLINDYILPARITATKSWNEMMDYQLASTYTTGDLGVISNIESRSLSGAAFLTRHDSLIISKGKISLPADAQLNQTYNGYLHVIVPAQRTSISATENFDLKFMVLGNYTSEDITFYYKSMGSHDAYKTIKPSQIKNGVYQISLDKAAILGDFEYYIEVKAANDYGIFPANAPHINQTVIVKD